MRTISDLGIMTASPGLAREPTRRLTSSSVLVAGVGALGSAAALQLAAAGIGRLILMDPDAVEVSNLHRQIIHGTGAIGAAKVDSARRILERGAPAVRIESRREALSAENWELSTSGVDFVIDATDRATAKFLINDAAVATALPFSHAGVVGLQGQTMTVLPGRSACLRCLFPSPPPEGAVASCQEAGILGPVAGVIGFLQASEAIRIVSGQPPLLADRLLTYDARTCRIRRVSLTRNPRCPACAATAGPDRAACSSAARDGADA